MYKNKFTEQNNHTSIVVYRNTQHKNTNTVNTYILQPKVMCRNNSADFWINLILRIPGDSS